jgi:hypothetical protein
MKEGDMGGACSTHRTKRNPYKVLVEKSEMKRPFERPWRRWGNNIKLGLN